MIGTLKDKMPSFAKKPEVKKINHQKIRKRKNSSDSSSDSYDDEDSDSSTEY